MSTLIISAAESASSLKHWIDIATLVASVTTPIAITIALLQYISINRASARAHMHTVFREYLALRASANAENEHYIIGYRYYAMEEAYFWIMKQRRLRNPAGWISKDEKAAWIETIKHHIEPDKEKAGHRYFHENRKIFGAEFQSFCDEVLGPWQEPALPAPV